VAALLGGKPMNLLLTTIEILAAIAWFSFWLIVF